MPSLFLRANWAVIIFLVEISLPLIVEDDLVIIRTLATLISHLTGQIYLEIVLKEIKQDILMNF